jgi:hypothetical protein
MINLPLLVFVFCPFVFSWRITIKFIFRQKFTVSRVGPRILFALGISAVRSGVITNVSVLNWWLAPHVVLVKILEIRIFVTCVDGFVCATQGRSFTMDGTVKSLPFVWYVTVGVKNTRELFQLSASRITSFVNLSTRTYLTRGFLGTRGKFCDDIPV